MTPCTSAFRGTLSTPSFRRRCYASLSRWNNNGGKEPKKHTICGAFLRPSPVFRHGAYYTTTTSRFLSSSNSTPRKGETKKGKKGKKKKSKAGIPQLTDAEKEAQRIEDETQAWVERVVVGMNLCPFAAKPLADYQLFVVMVRGDDIETILRNILAQAQVFTKEGLPGTALVVCPELFPKDFYAFLDVLNMVVDGLLEDFDLVGKVQVVPFHPKFVFAGGEEENDKGEENDDEKMEYWTNRSPYPMFHILKEDDVSRAVKVMKGDTDRVWQRNVHLLQQLEDETCTAGEDRRTQLETYLLSGKDGSNGDMKALVQQALADTAKEFPLLAKPILREEKVDEEEEDK